MTNSLNRVDWELLHRQKLVLLELLNGMEQGSPSARGLRGIVHLLDALQDEAEQAGLWKCPRRDRCSTLRKHPPRHSE